MTSRQHIANYGTDAEYQELEQAADLFKTQVLAALYQTEFEQTLDEMFPNRCPIKTGRAIDQFIDSSFLHEKTVAETVARFNDDLSDVRVAGPDSESWAEVAQLLGASVPKKNIKAGCFV